MTNDSPLLRIRAACLALPETSEKPSHGQPTFFVAGKQFAQFRDNHHVDGRTVVCVRVSGSDEQAMLLDVDPATYSKPAYLPPWLAINLAPVAPAWSHVEDLPARSCTLAGPARALNGGQRGETTS